MRPTSATLAGTAAAVVILFGMLGNRMGSMVTSATPPPAVPSAQTTGAPGPGPAGLSPRVRARIPADSYQVVLVSGTGRDSSDSTLTLWTRAGNGSWQSQFSWPAHNGRDGWSGHHLFGDLRSPVGVYSLSDAGGRRPDPGALLPYHWDEEFTADGTGFEGEALAGSFDYVIAIDYNRVPGSSPLDDRRPLGGARGGGIWLHVDHGGPTHGCVTVSESHMLELLRTLDPADHPVIVMGPGLV